MKDETLILDFDSGEIKRKLMSKRDTRQRKGLTRPWHNNCYAREANLKFHVKHI